MNEYEAVMEW